MDEIRLSMMRNQRSVALFSLYIWLILGGIICATSFLVSGGVADDIAGTLGLGKEMAFEGAVVLASILCAAGCTVLTAKLILWKVAFYLCLASAAVTLLLFWIGDTSCIYFFLFGLLCLLRIRNIKPLFKS